MLLASSARSRVSFKSYVPVDQIEVQVISAKLLQRVIESPFNLFWCMEGIPELCTRSEARYMPGIVRIHLRSYPDILSGNSTLTDGLSDLFLILACKSQLRKLRAGESD